MTNIINPKRNEIILVTYEFPFGTSETFLESEVKYLSNNFEKIWILPSRAVWSPNLFKSGKCSQRVLPENFIISLPAETRRFSVDAIMSCLAIRKLAVINNALKVPRYIREKIAWREAFKAGLLVGMLKKMFKNDCSIYAYSYWNTESATALAYLKKKRSLPGFVTRCHRGDLYDEVMAYPIRPYRQLVAQEADFIIPVSKNGVEYLANKNFPRSKLVLQRLGVKRAERPAIPSDDGILRILSCSNIIAVKRVTLIAKSLLRLERPFQWIHFGDGIERNHVEEIASQIPPYCQVLLPGRLPNRAVLNHYTSCPVDVFINVSSSEGVPVSIMEALAHGIPCIATDVGGTGELLDDTCGKLLENAITPELLAKELSRIVPKSNAWLNKRQGAIKRWEEKASADKNYTELMRFLKCCIDNRSLNR
jgi:glycosyltransferase involved in cell wall biosynthesis